ncbi:MAG: NADH-quinone oxidoreductase subunit J [Proteobacteria bacterium]|nr:NADH-quinone oxidoreductase subunit J [Pseudomonadota bacterium]
MLPAGGVLVAVATGGRIARLAALALLPCGLVLAVAIAALIRTGGVPLEYRVGGWAPPLGVALRADGLSAVMLLITAIVIAGIALFARDYFPADAPDETERRAPFVFWTLLMGLWGALNAVWLGADLFNLYVALELLTFGAVPLVSLDGKPDTLRAALRYLLFALIGSVLYLLGVGLIYGAAGTLDIAQLAAMPHTAPVFAIAAALMTAGLLAKTALFPLHLWLPPAHAGAPAAASALLSALVVKGSFILAVRLWFDALPGAMGPASAQLLGWLGAAAVVFGGAMALRQQRLKLLVAYSTVGQIGYLFFLFPLAFGAAASDPAAWRDLAWTGGIMQVVAHAAAKAAMFMAAGLIGEALGHDRIDGFGGLARALPVTVFAFGLAGMSLMGLPPSGGFVAKAMLLTASVAEAQWWWAVAILAGGLLAAGYLFRVLGPAMAAAAPGAPPVAEIPLRRQAVVLGLAVFALLLGLVPLRPSPLLDIGRATPPLVLAR